MKISHHDHQYLEAELTPQDARWRVRAIGTGIMLALTLIYFGHRLLMPQTTIPEPVLYGIGIILLPLTGFAVNTCLTYETKTLRFDKIQNRFHIVQRNLMGQRVLEGNLRSIQDVRVTRSASDDGDTYQVGLQLSGQPAIPLTPTNQRITPTQLAEFAPLREFLGLPGLPRPM